MLAGPHIPQAKEGHFVWSPGFSRSGAIPSRISKRFELPSRDHTRPAKARTPYTAPCPRLLSAVICGSLLHGYGPGWPRGSELPKQHERAPKATHCAEHGGMKSNRRRGQHHQPGDRTQRLSHPDRLHARPPGSRISWAAEAHQQRQHQREQKEAGEVTGFEQCQFTHSNVLSVQSDKPISLSSRAAGSPAMGLISDDLKCVMG